MRIAAAVGMAALAAGAANGQMAGTGFPREGAAATLRRDFAEPPPGYGEVPFWWWTGDKLDKGRLLEQIEALHKAGISGNQVNYSHTRSGNWRTADVEPGIFSDEWWEVFNFAAEESAKRGMGIGLSGYTIDWPGNDNLFAKLGISAEDTLGRRLQMRCEKSRGGKVGAFADGHLVSAAAFPAGGGEPVLLGAGGGELPRGEWEVRVVTAPPVERTLDPLNPESARRVIERFLDPFEKRLSAFGRSALNYFFQDELRLAGDVRVWGDDFAEEFRKRKGYDILPWVSALCGDAGEMTAKVRLDANDVQVQLTEERYFKPVYEWHASRGLIYACDPGSRGRNPLEFGDYMRSMRWYTAPGFDTPGTSADVVKNKVGSSIAHLYGRPRTWLEGYHSQGWQASTTTIFDSSARNFAYGSSILNLHGLYYSTYGGWWEWAPPCYHFRMPYWVHMGKYLKYFERISYALTQGRHVCDVAVVNPLEPLVVDRKAGEKPLKLSHRIVEELATRRSVDLDYIDGESILRAEIRGGRLCVAGEEYRVVVAPDMFAMRSAVLRKLHAFRAAGGQVAVFGRKPELTDAAAGERAEMRRLAEGLASVELPADPRGEDWEKLIGMIGTRDFAGPGETKVLHRRIGEYDLYYLVDLNKGGAYTFRVEGEPEIWDPWTGVQKKHEGWERVGDGTTRVFLKASRQPVLLAFAPGARKRGTLTEAEALAEDAPEAVKALEGEWSFRTLPTMDNKWGDYRLPATKELIGAEIRKFASDLPGEAGAKCTVEFGPQFRVEETGELHYFSWRWGEETRPGFQDWHHGLNRVVGDDFFTLGNYDVRLYDVAVKSGEKAKPVTYATFAHAPEDCRVKVVAHGAAPKRVLLAGREVVAGQEVELKAGWHELKVHYETFGRAALVLMRTDMAGKGSGMPLSMAWHGDARILKYDPFGGAVKETKFRATVPPGFRRARMVLAGELAGAACGGKAMAVRKEGGEWVAETVGGDAVRGGEIELRVKPAAGAVGCGAFCGPVKLECGTGLAELGDWARFDGLECYSGGAEYVKEFALTEEEAGRRVTIDLGRVGATCDVAVNGVEAGVLCTPPWRLDLTGKVMAGANKVRVRAYNTLNNHYQTVPTRYKRPVRNEPSGLLGPVKIELR